MDWRIVSLYKDYIYDYNISQSFWQRIKGRLTNRYEVTISTPGVKKSNRTYLLTSDYQRRFNPEYLTRQRSLLLDLHIRKPK